MGTTVYVHFLEGLETIEEIQQLTLWFCCLEPWQEEGLKWVQYAKMCPRFMKQRILRWLR